MTQAIPSVSIQENTPARQYLSQEQELSLIAQVRERTQLLKSNPGPLTQAEQRLRIRGERAFNQLLADYRGTIRRLIHRYSFLNRISFDEMYQIALIAFEKAVSSFNPNCSGKQRKFSSWVFLKISSMYISLYRAELCHSQRFRVAFDALRSQENPNEYQPPEALPMTLKPILIQEIESSLAQDEAQLITAFYFQKQKRKIIAAQHGCTVIALSQRKHKLLRQLSTNPRLQALATAYIA